MRTRTQLMALIACLFLMAVSLTACGKKEPKKGKVVIKNYQFVLRQDSTHTIAVDAVGTVQNVGDYDVQNVVITGSCPSCQLKWLEGIWFTSNTPPSKDEEGFIGYLPKGGTAKFRVKAIAMMMIKDPNASKNPPLPKKLDVKVYSFDTVQ